MLFAIQRELLLRPLQSIVSITERRQTMPILANVLLDVRDSTLLLTGTDLEAELSISLPLVTNVIEPKSITVSAHKLFDICRVAPENAILEVSQNNSQVVVKVGQSVFNLATLPANGFPKVDWQLEKNTQNFEIDDQKLLEIIASTSFAMAVQDTRHFLNGMLLELNNQRLSLIASDGHRLALNSFDLENPSLAQNLRVIIPRKSVLEISRLLADTDSIVKVMIGKNHIQLSSANFIFTSKLIDSQFPNYHQIIPKDNHKILTIDAGEIQSALERIAILTDEISCGVRLTIAKDRLELVTSNQEKEKAVEVCNVDYRDAEMVISFNIRYMLDAVSNIKTEKISFALKNDLSSVIIREVAGAENKLYVIMPLCV